MLFLGTKKRAISLFPFKQQRHPLFFPLAPEKHETLGAKATRDRTGLLVQNPGQNKKAPRLNLLRQRIRKSKDRLGRQIGDYKRKRFPDSAQLRARQMDVFLDAIEA